MIILSALRDFADGLTRGFSLFFSERNDFIVRSVTMETAPPRR